MGTLATRQCQIIGEGQEPYSVELLESDVIVAKVTNDYGVSVSIFVDPGGSFLVGGCEVVSMEDAVIIARALCRQEQAAQIREEAARDEMVDYVESRMPC